MTALPSFSRDPDRAPAILHPGRGDAWWVSGGRVAWHDGAALWGVVGDDVRVAPCPPPRAVWATATGWRAWTARATVTLDAVGSGVVAGRVGDGLTVRRVDDAWVVDGAEVPEAVAVASAVWPFPVGRGLLFRSAGWLFRIEAGRIRAVAPATGKERVVIGPHGAFLIGDRDGFKLAGAPGRSASALPVRLRADAWGVRWADDGGRVAGIGPDGRTARIDLRTGAVDFAEGLPLDVDRTLGPDGAIAGVDWPRAPVREASWARSGNRLAGPGGSVWDLRHATILGPAAVRLGATCAVDGRWATVDWESGDGAWLDADGTARGTFHLPLAPGESVDGAVDGVFVTDADRGLAVGPDGAITEVEPPPLPAPPRVAGLRIGKAGADVAGARIAVEAAAEVAGRVLAWGTEGWLVRVR